MKIELTARELTAMQNINNCYDRLRWGNHCSATNRKLFEEIQEITNNFPVLNAFVKFEMYHRAYRDCVVVDTTWFIKWEPKKEYRGRCAYIVELEDKNQIKVGKTDNFAQRKKDLEKQYGTVNTIHLFKFEDTEDAYMMEVLLHRFFKQYYPNSRFIPQDRFENADYTLAELEMLDKVAEELKNKKWF